MWLVLVVFEWFLSGCYRKLGDFVHFLAFFGDNFMFVKHVERKKNVQM